MGNENSRPEAAATQLNLETRSEAQEQALDLLPEERKDDHQQPVQHVLDRREDQATTPGPRPESPPARNSLKRSIRELQRDEDNQGSPRVPSGPKLHRGSDCYRPRAAPFPDSPPDTRYSFIPDRTPDCWHPESGRDYRRDFANASPGQAPQPGYSRRRSSPARRSQSPRTGSSAARQISTQHGGHETQAAVSPSRTRRESEVKADRIFPDLNRLATETAPSEAEVDRIDFNGLKQVPTGPKQVPTGPRLAVQCNVGTPLPHLPHIFISKEHLPVHPSTVKHLRRFLKKYMSNDAAISLDPSGYYIPFEDTDNGRNRLDLCYRNHHLGQLFSMYELRMEPYPRGLPSRPATSEDLRPSSIPGDVHDVAKSPRVDAEAGVGINVTEKPWSTQPRDLAFENASTSGQVKHPGLSSNDQTTAAASQKILESERHQQRSSPLRVPSRTDKDDCSSSITGSDVSSSKQSKCHVCKTTSPFETDSLVHCSSCPRKYHRRCHTQAPVATELGKEHFWQCQRCMKKKLRPRSRLSDTLLAVESHPTSQPQEPPTKKPRLEAAAFDLAFDAAKITTKSSSPGQSPPLRHAPFETEPMPAKPLEQTTDAVNSVDNALSASDQMHLQEAEDLVDQSFASSADTRAVKHTKPRTLKLVRTKLAQRDVESCAEPMKTHVEVTPPRTSLSTTEPTQEPSVGDLRPDSAMAEPKRKTKPHRWSGTGADKDIVQVGLAQFFLKDNKPEAMPASAEDLLPPAASNTLESHEVSEKTREATGGKASRSVDDGSYDKEANPRSLDQSAESFSRISAVPHVDHDLQKPTDIISTGEGCPQGKDPSRKPGPIKRRTGPGSNALNKCSKCSRRIAAGPAGTNELCTSCRLEQRADLPLEPSTSSKSNAKAAQLEDGDDLDLWTPRLTPPRSRVHARDNSSLRISGTEIAPDEDLIIPQSKVVSGEAPDARCSDSATPQGKTVRKRKSYARDANGEHDYGNYESRPKGSYQRLILLALCDAPGHRLRGKDVVDWVAKNIRGYSNYESSVENDKWRSGLNASLSLYREGTFPKALWRKIDLSEGRCLWELLPGIAAKLPQWDPILNELVSPPRELCDRLDFDGGKEKALANGGEEFEPKQGRPGSKSKTKTARKDATSSTADRPDRVSEKLSKRPEQRLPSPSAEGLLHAPTPMRSAMNDASEVSSEEEPIVRSRRKARRAPIAAMSTRSMEQIDSMTPKSVLSQVNASTINELGLSAGLPDTPQTMNSPPQVKRLSRPLVDVKGLTLAQLVRMDAENVDYSAKSLFEEWPEYDPHNQVDRDAKVAEIKRRPNKKQRMAIASTDSWLRWGSVQPQKADISNRSSLSVERSFRNSGATFDQLPWNEEALNEKRFDDLDKFFDLPHNPMAIVHDGQLAYRDGTRNDDGILPRAKVVYRTGYA